MMIAMTYMLSRFLPNGGVARRKIAQLVALPEDDVADRNVYADRKNDADPDREVVCVQT